MEAPNKQTRLEQAPTFFAGSDHNPL